MAESLPNVDDDVMELSEAVEFIHENARDIVIYEKQITPLAKMAYIFLIMNQENIDNQLLRPTAYPHEYVEDTNANWLFVLHTLNFALWYPKQTKQWIVNNKTGYLALCEAVKRAFENNKPLWNPKFYAKVTRSELEHIFRSDDGETCIPLIDERLKILHEVGQILLNKYKGTFMECIKSSDYNADKLIKLLYDEFESYRDEVLYNKKKIRFLVKARALMLDLWRYFENKLKFQFNINEMIPTIFIDYRISQYLLETKILRLGDQLKKKLHSNGSLVYGSKDEIELRGCLLFVVKEICKKMHDVIHDMAIKYPNQMKKSFKIPNIVNNFLFDEVFLQLKYQTLENSPFNYIRNVYY